MAFTEEQITGIKKTYDNLQPSLQQAVERLASILRSVASTVEDRSLVRFKLQPTRIKTLQSILRKAEQKNVAAEDIFHEIHDLVGARIVCNNINDVHRFHQLLREHLQINGPIDKEDLITNPQSTGYRALHIDVRIDVGDPLMPERIPCEIQIRTLLQHSWAELAHDDVYKAVGCIPPDLQDRMADLAESLASADRIAQNIRERIGQGYDVGEAVNLDVVTLEGLASVFSDTFGRLPQDYAVHAAYALCRENGLQDLHRLKEVLADQEYLDRIRNAYSEDTGFGFDPSHEALFEVSVFAAVRDTDAALEEISRRAQLEKQEVDEFWSREVLSGLPDTLDEFLEQVEDLDLDSIAEALEVAKTCDVCAEKIIDMDSFAEAIVDWYGADGSEEIWGILIGTDARADHDDPSLCPYHAYVMSKDT